MRVKPSECGTRNAECEMLAFDSEFGIRNSKFTPGNPHSAFRISHSGFTLLEVMVAVAILAMVLVTLLGVKNRSMQDVLLAEHMTTATLLAKREMTETLLTKPLTPKEEEGEFEDEEFKDYTWKKSITSMPIDLSKQVTEVRITILWKEGERQESVELVSYE